MRGLRAITTAAILAAVVVSAAPAATAAPSATPPLRSNNVNAFTFRVACGVQLEQLGGISCFAASLPSTELDGYVELHGKGEAKLGERGDSPWRGGKSKRIRKGQSWQRAGVTCELGGKLRCENAAGHGFTLTPKTYELF